MWEEENFQPLQKTQAKWGKQKQLSEPNTLSTSLAISERYIKWY